MGQPPKRKKAASHHPSRPAKSSHPRHPEREEREPSAFAQNAKSPRPRHPERRPKAGVEGSSRPLSGPCPLARECGSCSQIERPYDEQLAAKQEAIAALFAPLAPDCPPLPILGMDVPLRYRDKIASPFAPARRGKVKAQRGVRKHDGASQGPDQRPDILCGMYAAGTHRIVPVADCPVENEAGRQVVEAVRRIMRRYGMEPYDEDAGTGFVRHVVVRVGHESGEVLVTVVTNGREFPGARNFCRELVRQCPRVTTIVQNVNTRQTNAIFGDAEQVLYGPGFILDTLCGLSFRISSRSFYQVNATQTEVLYRVAVDMAQAGTDVFQMDSGASQTGSGMAQAPSSVSQAAPNAPVRTLMDAYCGTGTIGLVAASLIPGVRVLGVDKVESAIRDARLNARHNGIENAGFAADDAGAYLKRMAARGEALDVLMMDPPRAGASEEFLEAALLLRPQRIVYISCNPNTQARDARVLLDGGYRIEAIQPVDMFPHTDHVECVAVLSHCQGSATSLSS